MQVVWELDNLDQLGDNKLDVGGRPRCNCRPLWTGLLSSTGCGDALFIGTNPLAGLEVFTIELDFRPMREGWPSSASCIGGSQRRPRAFRDASDWDGALVSRHLYQLGRLGPSLVK